MYERRGEKLLSPRDFALRVGRHGGVVLIGVCIALSVGVAGYHWLVKLRWIDALLNASMILGGMGPVDPIKTNSGKIFASLYALLSGLFLIAATGVLLAPFFHRLMHRFHLEKKGKDE
ncbi:MAG TPA: hypothetical protein VL284_07635 [Thermoanaerobaculia bacterium]|nr:hypothetical protein [Thermoanaerobaculia bacterium]